MSRLVAALFLAYVSVDAAFAAPPRVSQRPMAVFLDGVSLPDDVYAALDFEAVVGEIEAAAGRDSYHGFWQGSEETGLFFFGADADDILARVEPVLRTLPIAQNARVVIRHGARALNPREVRMPRP